MKNKHIGTLLKKLVTVFLTVFLMVTNSAFVYAQDETTNDDNPNANSDLNGINPLEDEEETEEPSNEDLDLEDPQEELTPFALDEDPTELTIPYDQTEAFFSKYYVNSSNINNLDGKTFAIVFNNSQYYMEPSYKNGVIYNGNNKVFDGQYMTAKKVNNYKGAVGLQTWTFEANEDEQTGGYYIKCEGSPYYLKIKEPNIFLPSDGSRTDYGDNVQNRPNALCLSLDKQVFYVDQAQNGEIYLYNRELDFKASINSFWAKTDSFVATTWPANSNIALYEAKPFGVVVDNENMTNSFGNTGMEYGIVRNSDGSYSIGEAYLPSIEEKDPNSNTYTLNRPGNFEPLTGYYVLTNEKEVNQAGLSEQRKMDIDARNGVMNWNKSKGENLNIDNYICPGNEYEFIDYVATDIDGNVVHLPVDTQISWRGSSLKAKLPSGEEIHLQYGQNIKATWKYISSLVTFHIDYTGTILDGDGDIERRTSTEKLTWAIAVGRIYNGKNLGNSTNMSSTIHDAIEQEYFVPDYDENNDDIQIQMELYASIPYKGAPNKVWQPAKLYNASNMTEGVLRYVEYSGSDITVKISPTSSSSTILDKANSNKDNYSVRWYAIKDNNQGNVHINGVFIAKTSTFTITSNFAGLPEDKLNEMMTYGTNSYGIDINVVAPNTTNNQYIRLDTNPNPSLEQSIMKYEGNKIEDKSFTWLFKSLNGSKHTLIERNYEVDGYTCVQTMMMDGNYYFDTPQIDGNQSRTIDFFNSYTLNDLGMFMVSNGTEDGHELTNAKYELTGENDFKKESFTNKHGMALFNNLEPGTYTLKQKEVPNGYELNSTVWTITVTKNEDGKVITTVTSSDENNNRQLYSSENKTMLPLTVKNKSNATTFVFEKKFGGEITFEQIEQLFTNGYQINLLNKNNEIVASFDKDKTKDNLKVSADGMTYVWTLTGIQEGEYVLKEENFDANFNSTYAEISDVAGDNVNILNKDVRHVPEYVEYKLNVLNGLSKLTSTTLYSKNIALEVEKVSSLDDSIKLEGAKFHLYTGLFSQAAKDAPDGVNKQVTYNIDGQNKRAYYLKDVVTNSNGIGLGENLIYDCDYVLIEYEAPFGYALETNPIVLKSAKYNTTDYYNGRLHAKVENSPATLKILLTSSLNNNVTKLKNAKFEVRHVETVNSGIITSENLNTLDSGGKYRDGYYIYNGVMCNQVYEIRLINEPQGYLKDNQPHYVSILDEEASDYNECLNLIQKLIDNGLDVSTSDNRMIVKELFVEPLTNYELVVQMEDGNSKDPLSGIGFTLYKEVENGTPDSITIKTTSGDKTVVKVHDEILTALDENNESTVKFENLSGNNSKYYLLQTKGLIGYLKSDTAIEISVNTSQEDDGSLVRDAKTKGIQTNMDGDRLKIKIWNYSKLEMPASGSDITGSLILVMGTLLIALSLLLLLQEKQLRDIERRYMRKG